MSVWATVDDLQDRYEQPITAESSVRVQTQLDDAEVYLTQEVGDLAARVTAGLTTANAVKIVVCNMVLRWLRNPGGFTSQTAGPFSYRLGSSASVGKFHLDQKDRRLLGLRAHAVSLELVDDALAEPMRKPPPSTLRQLEDSEWEL